jgi:hypothetical protein
MDLTELATLAVLFIVTLGVTLTVLMSAQLHPCRNCRRRSGQHHQAAVR